jgi:predicted nucleic acid-binding Zn ribbon protein
MAIHCPACGAQIAEDSRTCPHCATPLEPAAPSTVHRVAIMFARLLILLTLVINIIGWVACLKDIDAAVQIGLANGILGFVLLVSGLVARYRWAWAIGVAHFALPFIMFAMVASYSMGPLRARPAFLWADAVFLVVIAPLSIIGCYRGAAIRRPVHPALCRECGYPLHGLTEPRCPECGMAFDPRQLSPPSSDARDFADH